MFRIAIVLSLVLLVAACAGNEKKEGVILSDGFLAIAEKENGKVDTDKYPNVRCKRIRLTGTHLIKKVCYTSEEEEKLARQHVDEYYRTLGLRNCDDQSCGGN